MSAPPAPPHERRAVARRDTLVSRCLVVGALGLAGCPPSATSPVPTASAIGPASSGAMLLDVPSATPFGAGSASAQPADEDPLRAALSPDSATFPRGHDVVLEVRIRNEGPSAVDIQTDELSSPILYLDVFDGDGRRVPTVPPGVPPAPEDRVAFRKSLAPGADFRASYTLDVFSPPLPAGVYTARMRGLPSNTVRFIVGAP